MVSGEIRRRDVQVGRHVAISPGALPRFRERFAFVYGRRSKTETVLAASAAHHRLLWMHPFLRGNGRVARGLARNVEDYKRLLANCDLPRRNDRDGRGSLSEDELGAFTEFFLQVCLDQVTFMEGLM